MSLLSIFLLISNEIWVAIIAGPLTLFIAKLIELSGYKRGKTFHQTSDEGVVVTNMLGEIKHQLRAKRSFVMQYHNGGSFYSGNPRQKVSMTHESYDENRAHSILRDFQELPISYFSSMTLRLNQDGKLRQDSIQDIQDHTFRRILSEDNVNAHYAYSIKKRKLIWVGIIPRLEYVMVSSVHFYMDDFSADIGQTELLAMESKVELMKKYLM